MSHSPKSACNCPTHVFVSLYLFFPIHSFAACVGVGVGVGGIVFGVDIGGIGVGVHIGDIGIGWYEGAVWVEGS